VGPRELDIFPLLLLMAKLGPGQGLGCETAEGSLVPTRKREYKPCSKHTEGKRPLYAIGFNFMDARYYDVFTTVGGNRVSF
jgi:polycomb protein EED